MKHSIWTPYNHIPPEAVQVFIQLSRWLRLVSVNRVIRTTKCMHCNAYVDICVCASSCQFHVTVTLVFQTRQCLTLALYGLIESFV